MSDHWDREESVHSFPLDTVEKCSFSCARARSNRCRTPHAEGGSLARTAVKEVCVCSQPVFANAAMCQPSRSREQMLGFGEQCTRVSDFKPEW